MHADGAASWDNLHEHFEIKGIKHQKAYSLDGARTHMAEKYLPCLRRAEIGVHDYIGGSYLLRDATESSWREETAASRMVSSRPDCRAGVHHRMPIFRLSSLA